MMTKSKKFLLLMLTLVVSVAGYAQTEINDVYYNLNGETKEAEVTGYSYGISSDVIIPSTVTNNDIIYKVTSIGNEAFKGNSLTSITIPETVTSIKYRAFAGSRNLTSIKIPNSVTNIGEAAFLSCAKLSSVSLSNSLKSIERSAFQFCGKLASITIPKSVTSIGDFAFDMCASLTSVTMANSVKSVGYRAFSYTGLASITMSNSLTSIGEDAFAGCSGLTSIMIPKSVTSIGRNAFYLCSGIISITIPNSVTSIETRTFSYCAGLTSVTIPNSVTSIGSDAFAGCSKLSSMTIPNSVTTIGECAFYDCKALTTVILPNSVTTIENYTFYECKSLASITIPGSVTSIGTGAFSGINMTLASVTNFSKTPQKIDETVFEVYGTLHVLPGCKAAYVAADVWKKFTIVEDAQFTPEMVEDVIATIGTVEYTVACKAKIAAARSAYDALTKEQQALVKNLSVLVEAENAYKLFETTGIADVEAKNGNKDGKFLENGKIVIVKNGKKYNQNGLVE